MAYSTILTDGDMRNKLNVVPSAGEAAQSNSFFEDIQLLYDKDG